MREETVASIRQFGISTNTRQSATSRASLASQQLPIYIAFATGSRRRLEHLRTNWIGLVPKHVDFSLLVNIVGGWNIENDALARRPPATSANLYT